MTQDRWHRLEDLFVAAIELSPNQQTHFVQNETLGDPELRDQLLDMIAHSRDAAHRIVQSIESVAQTTASSDSWVGRHFGPYQIVREIGRGGMGIVFEAVRDDDEYRKRVALKIPPGWSDAALMQERLRHERQILAGLEHPNIARFLDGGSEAGVPYIVMEFVEGVRITDYCRQQPLETRILLFRQVCAAVHHAHASLIVHRDLKPANILVTQDGVPKLLDFGIAKILGPLASGGETTNAMLWTPDYTSPEQVRGSPVTIRTDVYSLGLILYEILCGERGQNADTSSPIAMDESICDSEPRPPSKRASARGERAIGHQLEGDLDTIVAMAIRKEPERRYGSALELSDDLGRYLEGRPVIARPGGMLYRAGKLVKRHRAAAVAVVLVCASLTAGAVSTVHQKRRAERRFEQVRKLAHTFVFDVHDRIQNLPGATEARKMIVQTALTYLETLQPDAVGDAALSKEIAAAYEKIGDVQGYPSTSNLGDTKGALESYRRADHILTGLVQQGDTTARLPAVSVTFKLGAVLRASGDIQSALKDFARAKDLYTSLLKESPNDREVLNLGGEIESARTRVLWELRDFKGSTEAGIASMEIARKLSSLDPSNRDYRASLAVAASGLGTAHLSAGQLEEAAADYRAAVETGNLLTKEDPNNVSVLRNLMVAYGNLGDVLGFRSGENLGDIPSAAAAFEKALEIARGLSERDPADRKSRFDIVAASSRLGALLVDDPQHATAGIRQLEETERILNGLLAEDPGNARFLYHVAYVCRRIGDGYANLKRDREAVQFLERAADDGAKLVRGPFGPAARELVAMANLRQASINKARALDLAAAVARELGTPPTLFRTSWTEAIALHDLARIYLRLGHAAEASTYLKKSRQRLQDAKLPAAFDHKRQLELASLKTDLEACQCDQGR